MRDVSVNGLGPDPGDPERIAQIVGKLLDHAITYSPPSSPIDVSLTVVGAEAQIRVADRGVGIPDHERDQLFAPFFRSSRTREIAGTGLGLHISRRIAEQHHGRLWLESTSGLSSRPAAWGACSCSPSRSLGPGQRGHDRSVMHRSPGPATMEARQEALCRDEPDPAPDSSRQDEAPRTRT